MEDLQKCKEFMLKIENSNAIPVPNVANMLVNLKRMQAELSKPEVMRKYLTEEEAATVETCLVKNWEFSSKN